MYYISIAIVIVSSVFYTFFQDIVPNNINPIVALFSMYLGGLLMALIFYIKTKKQFKKKFNVEKRVLAFAITNMIIDFGFLMAFRSGWGIGILNVFTNIIILIALAIIGIIFFKEKLNVINIIGIVVGIFGLTLLSF